MFLYLADDVAKFLSCNTKLQQLYLDNNSFKTEGMSKIARALQNISTLTLMVMMLVKKQQVKLLQFCLLMSN